MGTSTYAANWFVDEVEGTEGMGLEVKTLGEEIAGDHVMAGQ